MSETPQLRNVQMSPLRTVDYRLWVNEERTVLFRLWDSGAAEVATRDDPSHTWGAPVQLTEERVA